MFLGGSMLSLKILKSRVSKMPFPAFWGKILQNSEDYRTPYINTQNTTLSTLNTCIVYTDIIIIVYTDIIIIVFTDH